MTRYEFISSYQSNSVFELDFDIRDSFDWYLKWDTLYVQHHENDEWHEYEPDRPYYDDSESHKHPKEVNLFIRKDSQQSERHSLLR